MLTRSRLAILTVITLLAIHEASIVCAAPVAGTSGPNELVIAEAGKSAATVVVSPDAGPWEKRAAEDLHHYIEAMSGAKPAMANTADTVAAALKSSGPLIIIGAQALTLEPQLLPKLNKVAKPNPVLRADAIALVRRQNRLYLAGLNDECHYYAVAELLSRWGCRWYLPTEFGECIPRELKLSIGELDYAYGPPFEVRHYWLSWIGDNAGRPEFMRRNRMNEVSVPNGHILGKYTKELVPPGKTMFNVPIAEDSTADHVAKQVAPIYAAGKDVMLGMEDGVYVSDSPLDKELMALQYDKYFLTQSGTDAFMTLYNKVAERLMKAHPESKAKIGFLAYANITLPPVRDITAKPPLVAYLAPIDIDPNHGMDSPLSAPRHEYKDMLYRWAKVMQGRLVIYDYDQGMLVWRDLPNPSLAAIRQDIKHYQKAGILGVSTESRGAMATTFLNLFFRGQLLWNPDADVDALLAEFYPKFYGPAAEPMAAYWNAIFKAWDETIVTEHEYFVAPAIYTPELVQTLRKDLEAAEKLAQAATSASGVDPKRLAERMRFTRLGFDVLDNYMQMVRLAAADVQYDQAAAAGERALAAREQLTEMSGTFTTYKKIGEHGYAWFPGEVKQYRELAVLTDGRQGTLIAKTPLVWAFRRDPNDQGFKENWQKLTPDLAWWKSQAMPESVASRQSNPGQWELVRTDLYLQAQGLVTKDFQSYTGHGWYHTELPLKADEVTGPVHLRFPGLFNECWLYVNGELAGHREQKGVWWLNDYRFEWDVDLAGKVKPGANSLVLRIHNPHHFGGMFRRPFLYRAVAVTPAK